MCAVVAVALMCQVALGEVNVSTEVLRAPQQEVAFEQADAPGQAAILAPRVQLQPSQSKTSFSRPGWFAATAPAPQETTDDGTVLPWVWTHIRAAIRRGEQNLPHHRRPGFYAVVGPVVVSNGFDRVAGIGAKGFF